jgi:hypothetical protein
VSQGAIFVRVCACNDDDCQYSGHYSRGTGKRMGQCADDAVRSVSVQGPTPSTYMHKNAESYRTRLPMCQACAEHAEKGA